MTLVLPIWLLLLNAHVTFDINEYRKEHLSTERFKINHLSVLPRLVSSISYILELKEEKKNINTVAACKWRRLRITKITISVWRHTIHLWWAHMVYVDVFVFLQTWKEKQNLFVERVVGALEWHFSGNQRFRLIIHSISVASSRIVASSRCNWRIFGVSFNITRNGDELIEKRAVDWHLVRCIHITHHWARRRE